jgi:hypothetical protein
MTVLLLVIDHGGTEPTAPNGASPQDVHLGMSRTNCLLRSNGDSANMGRQPRDKEWR